ncbi:hypothetical protein [Terrabacter sp. 2YAF2]
MGKSKWWRRRRFWAAICLVEVLGASSSRAWGAVLVFGVDGS